MFNTTDDAEDPDRLYELYAVVVHIGGNAYHGHYVSVIKTQDRGWLLFDDEMVEPVDKSYVRNFFGDKPGMACAYVLFYQETTLEAVQREQEADGLADVTHASNEASAALGHPQPNGTYPASVSKQVSIPGTPIEERDGFMSLDHAVTAPLLTSPIGAAPPAHISLTNTSVLAAESKKDKAERERAKREAKEAEKARKAAEKEKAKEDERLRKERETKRKEELKTQAEQMKAVVAASKQSAVEEEEKRKAENSPMSPISPIPENKEGFMKGSLRLSRSNRGSKSMSRKSFGWLKSGEGSKDNPDTAVDGEAGPPTPEKHEKPMKERFSFSLGKKKSTPQLP
jgi:ubiquitin carboxyl-terminal hydrolase 9/13